MSPSDKLVIALAVATCVVLPAAALCVLAFAGWLLERMVAMVLA